MNKQEAIQLGEEMKQNPFIKCNHCNSPFVRKEGKKYYKYNDLPKQKYYCNDCKKNFVFVPTHYIKPRKIDKKLGKTIIRLYRQGFSIRKIKQSLTEEIGNMTIWRFLNETLPK